MRKTVSVIVPAYNTEKYISKCIESLRNQSYQEIEILLINDGSIDETLSICRRYEKEDKRIRVIDKENTGVSNTRNIGLKECTGDYVIFVDSDDYMSEDYISTLVLTLEESHSQMVCVEYSLVNENEEYSTHESILKNGESKCFKAKEAINLMVNKNAYQGYLWNKIFIKDILIKNNIFFDERIKIWEDMLFCLRYLFVIDSVTYINVPLYYYVQRSNSLMKSHTNWFENTHLIALDEMWKLIKNEPGMFHDYIRDFYANDLVGMLGTGRYKEKKKMKEIIKTIDTFKAELTFKHKIKLMVYKALSH